MKSKKYEISFDDVSENIMSSGHIFFDSRRTWNAARKSVMNKIQAMANSNSSNYREIDSKVTKSFVEESGYVNTYDYSSGVFTWQGDKGDLIEFKIVRVQ